MVNEHHDVVLIACGSKKVETKVPVQAWSLYTGAVFRESLRTALSFSSNVRIVSAGYGLLRLNDMVMSYDRKMNGPLALEFRRRRIVEGNGYHLLPISYLYAIPSSYESLLPYIPSMGDFVRLLIENRRTYPLLHLRQLKNGTIRELLQDVEGLKQAHRTGGGVGICSTIHETLSGGWHTMREVEEILIDVCGEPVGGSYLPTIQTQLHRIPMQHGKRLCVRSKGKEAPQYRFQP